MDHIKNRNQITELHTEAENEPAVTNQALHNISTNEIMVEIQKLPPTTHVVFVMYVIDEFNHREIAKQLQISQGTSKWYLSEARKFLQ